MTHANENDLAQSELVPGQQTPDTAATNNGLYESQFTDDGQLEQWQSDNPDPAESEKKEEKVVTNVKKVTLHSVLLGSFV